MSLRETGNLIRGHVWMRKCICVECIACDSSAGLLGGDVQCAAESMGLKAGEGKQVWRHKSGNHPHRGDD